MSESTPNPNPERTEICSPPGLQCPACSATGPFEVHYSGEKLLAVVCRACLHSAAGSQFEEAGEAAVKLSQLVSNYVVIDGCVVVCDAQPKSPEALPPPPTHDQRAAAVLRDLVSQVQRMLRVRSQPELEVGLDRLLITIAQQEFEVQAILSEETATVAGYLGLISALVYEGCQSQTGSRPTRLRITPASWSGALSDMNRVLQIFALETTGELRYPSHLPFVERDNEVQDRGEGSGDSGREST